MRSQPGCESALLCRHERAKRWPGREAPGVVLTEEDGPAGVCWEGLGAGESRFGIVCVEKERPVEEA